MTLDPERLPPGDTVGGIPTVVVNAKPTSKRKRRRKGLVLHVEWGDIVDASVTGIRTMRAFQLWLLIRLERSLKKSDTVQPRMTMMKEIGLGDRKARKRAFDELADVGLVEVVRVPGRPTTVKITGGKGRT